MSVFAPHHIISNDMLGEHPDMIESFKKFKSSLCYMAKGTYAIRFIGDSTMRNLFHALCLILGQPIFPNSKTGSCIGQIHDIYIKTEYIGIPYCDPLNINDEFINVRGCGLWYLNPTPFTHYSWNVTKWKEYKHDLHRISNKRDSVSLNSLVLTTPHYICNHTMRQLCKSNVSPYQCKYGQRNSLGSYHLGKTVRQVAREYIGTGVVLFDAERLTMTKCKYNLKDDDLHFHKFIFFELYALWHKIFRKKKQTVCRS